MSPLLLVLGLLAAQRLIELVLAKRNTAALMAQGAVEIGAAHYPLFIVLHVSWFLALILTTPIDARVIWPLVGLLVLVEFGRIWVMTTLGRYFTTRIITLPGAPLVRRGPYRWLNHPNYAVVVAEIALVPLMFGNVFVATIWSVLNALLLHYRIGIENGALADRRRTSEELS